MKLKTAGFTLLEIMLVLVIAASLLMLGYKFYLSIKSDADVRQIQYNVDRVFAAASEYYQANCRQQVSADPSGPAPTLTATLDPANSPSSPYAVTVSALRTAGFLDATLPINRLIDTSTLNGGYIVQFNEAPANDKLVNGKKTGNIYIWTIQVAVAVRTPPGGSPLAIVRLLGADCAGNVGAVAGTVNSCNSGIPATTGSTVYAVWERLPSYAAPNAEANTWMGNAQVKSFTQLYTNSNIGGGIPGPSGTQTNYQNYLCGS